MHSSVDVHVVPVDDVHVVPVDDVHVVHVVHVDDVPVIVDEHVVVDELVVDELVVDELVVVDDVHVIVDEHVVDDDELVVDELVVDELVVDAPVVDVPVVVDAPVVDELVLSPPRVLGIRHSPHFRELLIEYATEHQTTHRATYLNSSVWRAFVESHELDFFNEIQLFESRGWNGNFIKLAMQNIRDIMRALPAAAAAVDVPIPDVNDVLIDSFAHLHVVPNAQKYWIVDVCDLCKLSKCVCCRLCKQPYCYCNEICNECLLTAALCECKANRKNLVKNKY